MSFKIKLKSLAGHNIAIMVPVFVWMVCFFDLGQATLWQKWWNYDLISGTNFWGRVNPEWRLCKYGRQQSPINIQPNKLLFDPNLKNIKLDAPVTSGIVMSSDEELIIELKTSYHKWINLTQGPLSYKYRVSQIKFHLSNKDSHGSEHHIAGKAFPAEMHVIAYNSDLYDNLTEASKGVKGLAIIGIFIDVGKIMHKSFHPISRQLQWMHKYKHRMAQVNHISIQQMMPKTTEYMTYEGSLSQPGCYETVTWIVMNKPLFIAKQQLRALRAIRAGSANEAVVHGSGKDSVPLLMNSRPVMPLNNRVVRTNINGTRKYRLCTMEKNMSYQVNTRYTRPIV